MGFDWRENDNGNWVLVGDLGVEATVYSAGLEWGGVWNGARDGKARRLKGKYGNSDEAMSAVDSAIAEGESSRMWWPPDEHWQPTKKGGFYRRHNGMVVSVKQARSGSWFASNGSAILGRYGRPSWFRTAVEAQRAVDAFAGGAGEWHWVVRRDAA